VSLHPLIRASRSGWCSRPIMRAGSRASQQALSFPSTFTCARFLKILALVNVLGPDRPESIRFGRFRTVSPFVRGSPDHSNNRDFWQFFYRHLLWVLCGDAMATRYSFPQMH